MLAILFLLTIFSNRSECGYDWFTDLKGSNSGRTTCTFLTLPVSADELARGPASSPGMMDATDLPLYSANSALVDRNNFAVHHLEWFMGLRKEYVGAIFPFLDFGAIGFFSQVFTPGKIENARDIDEQPSDPSLIELSFGVTFAKILLNRKLNIGSALSYTESSLDHEAGRAFSGALDILYKPFPWFSSRIYCANAGTNVYYGDIAESLPLRAGFSMQFFPLPSGLPLKSYFDFDVGIGILKTADEPLTTGISSDMKIGKYFDIKAGYQYAPGDYAIASGLGLGAGVNIGKYGFDIGWRNMSRELGPVWAATVKMHLDEILPKNADEYFNLAQKHYLQNRLNLSQYYASKALKIDRNMWKAHALMSRIKSEILRNKGLEIALIYSGNIKDQFLPQPGQGSLGGLARQATAIKILKGQFPVNFTIQAGNLLTARAHPLRVQLAGYYYEKVKYNTAGCGNGELGYGLKRLIATPGQFKQSLICTNHQNSSKPPLIGDNIIQSGVYNFYVATYVNQSLVNGENGKPLEDFAPDKLFPARAKNYDLRILIMHDTWENIKVKAGQIKDADIIICGNINQRFPSPVKIDSTLILSAGENGEYLGNLVMRFDEKKHLISTENHLIPLSPDIPPDSAIEEATRVITARIDLARYGIDEQDLCKGKIEGTIPFISDRDGSSGIYLKVVEKNAEFPVTRQNGSCFNPSISFSAEKIAYLNGSAQYSRLEIMEITGAAKWLVLDSSYVKQTVFSSDGKWLYYSAAKCADSTVNIYRVRSEGGPSFPVIAWENSNEYSIDFSSDNKFMVFCSDRTGSSQIYLTDPEGNKPVSITDNSAQYIYS